MLRTASLIFAFVMAVSLADTGASRIQAAAKTSGDNVAVIYFSATGTTKTAAKRIGKKTKGKVLEIKAADPYTDDDLNYGNSKEPCHKRTRIGIFPCKEQCAPGNFQHESHQKSG